MKEGKLEQYDDVIITGAIFLRGYGAFLCALKRMGKLEKKGKVMSAGLNETPSGNRIHIGFFGCRNAGKSSVVNAVTGQELAVVSEIKGTTTDPVIKAMELLPLGPVVIIDTPGFDDEGLLGEKRIQKTKQTLNRSDLAVLVVDGQTGMKEADRQLLAVINQKQIPCQLVYNKKDLVPGRKASDGLWVSAKTGEGIHELKERLGAMAPVSDPANRLLRGIVHPGDLAVMVCPVDESAPKGRLILPQQQAIRDCLDLGAAAVVTRELELAHTLEKLGTSPSVVITDSQAFRVVNQITPKEIPLTSFSILMARYKGFLQTAAAGAAAVDKLKDGDRILMAEGCTHHRQCNDIGTVKIPNWLRKYTGLTLHFETCSGRDFPEDLSGFSMVIHCGGCMITEREVQYRMRCAMDQQVPFTNYGIMIARMTGALQRSLQLFPELIHKVKEKGDTK